MPTKPAAKGDYLRLVPAVDQAVRILFALQNRADGASLTEISQEVGIGKSKGLAILNTLQSAGIVTRSERSKIYRLGPALLPLSRALLDHTDVAQAAAPYLRALAAATGSTTLLGMVAGGHLFVMARAEPPNGPGIAVHVGHRRPLYSASHGKAVLAALPEEERERVLTQGPLHFAPTEGRQALDLDSLRDELTEVRRLGYGQDLGLTTPGLNAVSAAVVDRAGRWPSGTWRVVGCLIVVGTFPPEKALEYGQRVAATAYELSADLAPLLHAAD